MKRILHALMAGLILIPGSSILIGSNESVKRKPTAVAQTTAKLTSVEQRVVEFFRSRGITDKMALAVLLGNIKQESLFTPNICEGGARVPYNQCHSGGYGLIQWTTVGRYNGLGRHARITGGDPSSLETQLSYLVTEPEWLAIEHKFKTPGQSMDYYMGAAYYWLGWGIHGERTNYSHHYYANMG